MFAKYPYHFATFCKVLYEVYFEFLLFHFVQLFKKIIENIEHCLTLFCKLILQDFARYLPHEIQQQDLHSRTSDADEKHDHEKRECESKNKR